MAEENKPNDKKGSNIVKKVFGRRDAGREHVSTLFTYKKQTQKMLPGGEIKAAADPRGALVFSPLPAAIDFGSSGIKLLQLGREPKGEVEVSLLDEELYEKTAGRDLWQQQKEALGKILLRNSVGRAAVIALSSKEVQVYNFVFSGMSEKELGEAVNWKLKQTRPFDLDIEKIRYGFVRWTSRSAAPSAPVQQRVMVVCAPAESVLKKVELLGQMGLKTLAVEVAPVSMMNLKKFRSSTFAADETALWLDLGAEESTIALERGGSALFFRNLAVTARQLTRQIAQSLRVEEPRAEELKRRQGLIYWSPEKEASGILQEEKLQKKEDEAASVYYGTVSSLENLVIDIEHSFKYFSHQVTQSQMSKFDRVILTGGGANLRNLDRFLSARLNVPVDSLNPLLGFRVREGLKTEKSMLLSNASSFAISLGLSLGQVIPKPMRINLLSAPHRMSLESAWKELRKKPRKALAAAACVALVFLGPQFARTSYYRVQLDGAEKKLKSAKSELSRLQAGQLQSAEEESRLSDKKKLLETKLEVLHESSQGSKQFSEILAKLSELLPEEVWITKLSYNERKMTIVGLTLKNELIVNFMEQLTKSDNFKDVTFNYTQKETNAKTYRFEVMMNVG